jgi:NAD(P)-dependent dehydrogenase (short-subunit alcohol dehydrogenase family)
MTKPVTKTFGAKSTTDEVLDGVNLSGKRVLVTGVSAGLGIETARTLAAHGATVVGTARDLDKAKRATSGIKGIELVEMDLASLKSVRAAADKLNAAGKTFDLVIANAGVMAIPTRTLTEDGFETQFGTNHLGHFVFINRIAPLFAPGSRLVNLSSAGHRYSDVNLEDPNFEGTGYTDFGAYGRSKTANILFAVEFDRRHKARGVRQPPCIPAASRQSSHATWRRACWTRCAHVSRRTTGRPACPHSSSRASRRELRPACGRAWWRRLRQSPADTARIAMSRKSSMATPLSAAACAPTPSTPSTPGRSGPRAKRWSANGSSETTTRTPVSAGVQSSATPARP